MEVQAPQLAYARTRARLDEHKHKHDQEQSSKEYRVLMSSGLTQHIHNKEKLARSDELSIAAVRGSSTPDMDIACAAPESADLRDRFSSVGARGLFKITLQHPTSRSTRPASQLIADSHDPGVAHKIPHSSLAPPPALAPPLNNGGRGHDRACATLAGGALGGPEAYELGRKVKQLARPPSPEQNELEADVLNAGGGPDSRPRYGAFLLSSDTGDEPTGSGAAGASAERLLPLLQPLYGSRARMPTQGDILERLEARFGRDADLAPPATATTMATDAGPCPPRGSAVGSPGPAERLSPYPGRSPSTQPGGPFPGPIPLVQAVTPLLLLAPPLQRLGQLGGHSATRSVSEGGAQLCPPLLLGRPPAVATRVPSSSCSSLGSELGEGQQAAGGMLSMGSRMHGDDRNSRGSRVSGSGNPRNALGGGAASRLRAVLLAAPPGLSRLVSNAEPTTRAADDIASSTGITGANATAAGTCAPVSMVKGLPFALLAGPCEQQPAARSLSDAMQQGDQLSEAHAADSPVARADLQGSPCQLAQLLLSRLPKQAGELRRASCCGEEERHSALPAAQALAASSARARYRELAAMDEYKFSSHGGISATGVYVYKKKEAPRRARASYSGGCRE
ncbi:hypothetical protein V8C86DRAFT_3132055, partial [Haematococcus lacustris]